MKHAFSSGRSFTSDLDIVFGLHMISANLAKHVIPKPLGLVQAEDQMGDLYLVIKTVNVVGNS